MELTVSRFDLEGHEQCRIALNVLCATMSRALGVEVTINSLSCFIPRTEMGRDRSPEAILVQYYHDLPSSAVPLPEPKRLPAAPPPLVCHRWPDRTPVRYTASHVDNQ